jgi:hypothetical protein
MTNATKANLLAALNACLGLAVLFGIPLSNEQQGGIYVAVNAVAAVFVGLTYKKSAKRIEEGT